MPITHKGQVYYRQGEAIDHHDIEGRHPNILPAERYDFLVKERERKNEANRAKRTTSKKNAG